MDSYEDALLQYSGMNEVRAIHTLRELYVFN